MLNIIVFAPKKSQQGSILLISVFVLIALTLLSLAASKSGLLQQKVTSHTKDSLLALQVAESALYEAQALSALQTYTVNGGAGGFYDGECDIDDDECYLSNVTDPFKSGFWSKSTAAVNKIQCGNGDDTCSRSGRFVIIRLGELAIEGGSSKEIVTTTNQYQDPDDSNNGIAYSYKIIAKGAGINPDTERVLVSYHASTD